MGLRSFWPWLRSWLLMLVLAVINGGLRDATYGRRMEWLAAHQLSTLIGATLLGAVMYGHVRRHPPASDLAALAVGAGWTVLTVAFEFLAFHYAAGHPWPELLANYDVSAGRVWVFLLLWVAAAPWLFHRLARSTR